MPPSDCLSCPERIRAEIGASRAAPVIGSHRAQSLATRMGRENGPRKWIDSRDEKRNMTSPRLGRRPRAANDESQRLPQSRTVLLQNAAELFARRGFEGVTVREIAELSNVTMPTLYHFFGDKRGLYLEACKHEFLDVTRRLLIALSGKGDSCQRLYNFTVEQCRVLLEPRPIAQLLRRELLEQDVEGIEVLSDLCYRPLLEQIAALVRDVAPDRDGVATVITLHALILGLTNMAPIQATVPPRPSLPVGPVQMAKFVLSTVIPEYVWPPEKLRR